MGHGVAEPGGIEHPGRLITEHPVSALKFLALVIGITFALTEVPALLTFGLDYPLMHMGFATVDIILVFFFARIYDQVRVWSGGIELVNVVQGRRFYEWWDIEGHQFVDTYSPKTGTKKVAALWIPGTSGPIHVGPPMPNVEEAWSLITRYVRERQ
jgi:hypothetical protein